MYLSAFVVAMSTWGAISSVRPLPFTFAKPCKPRVSPVCLSTQSIIAHKHKAAGSKTLEQKGKITGIVHQLQLAVSVSRTVAGTGRWSLGCEWPVMLVVRRLRLLMLRECDTCRRRGVKSSGGSRFTLIGVLFDRWYIDVLGPLAYCRYQ